MMIILMIQLRSDAGTGVGVTLSWRAGTFI